MRKTIVRLDLQGLQKRFKALDAITTSKMKGKTVYYDVEGNYLGQVGSSYTMKFLAPGQDYSYIEHFGLEDAGSFFKNLSTSDQKSFIQSKLPLGANVEIETISGSTIMGWGVINGQITKFRYNPNHFSFNNFKDFESNMAHEHYHYNNGHDANEPAYEIQAILAQVSHNSYNETTDAHKLTTAKYLFKQWEDLEIDGQTGYTKADAYRICKYTGTSSY